MLGTNYANSVHPFGAIIVDTWKIRKLGYSGTLALIRKGQVVSQRFTEGRNRESVIFTIHEQKIIRAVDRMRNLRGKVSLIECTVFLITDSSTVDFL